MRASRGAASMGDARSGVAAGVGHRCCGLSGPLSRDRLLRRACTTHRQLRGARLQDDVLPGTATVREYMLFHDSLRGAHRNMHAPPAASRVDPGGLDRVRRRSAAVAEARQWHRITALLQDLGLLKSQDTLIGDAFTRGISGGEKRRLSVAVELLAAPQLLFLDEPTTGAPPYPEQHLRVACNGGLGAARDLAGRRRWAALLPRGSQA